MLFTETSEIRPVNGRTVLTNLRGMAPTLIRKHVKIYTLINTNQTIRAFKYEVLQGACQETVRII